MVRLSTSARIAHRRDAVDDLQERKYDRWLCCRYEIKAITVIFPARFGCRRTGSASQAYSPSTQIADDNRAGGNCAVGDRAQPFGKHRIMRIEDLTLAAGRNDAHRRMIEIVDGVQQFSSALIVRLYWGNLDNQPDMKRFALLLRRQYTRFQAIPMCACCRCLPQGRAASAAGIPPDFPPCRHTRPLARR